MDTMDKYTIVITEDQRALIEKCLITCACGMPGCDGHEDDIMDLAYMITRDGDNPIQSGEIISDFTPDYLKN